MAGKILVCTPGNRVIDEAVLIIQIARGCDQAEYKTKWTLTEYDVLDAITNSSTAHLTMQHNGIRLGLERQESASGPTSTSARQKHQHHATEKSCSFLTFAPTVRWLCNILIYLTIQYLSS